MSRRRRRGPRALAASTACENTKDTETHGAAMRMPRQRDRMGSMTFDGFVQIITSLQALEDFSMVLLRPACACLDSRSTSTISITLNAGPFFCAPVFANTNRTARSP